MERWSSDRLALWAAAGTGFQVGAAIIASRYALTETTPAALALMRYVVGFLCLAPVAWRLGLVRFAWRDVGPIAVLGVGQFGILVALLNASLLFIPAAPAALLFSTFPFMTMLLAAMLGREGLSWAKTLGVGLTVAGVGFTLGIDVLRFGAGHEGEVWIGVLLALASAFTGALCSVFYRPYLQRYPTVQVSAFAMLASVLFLTVPAFAEGFFAGPPDISAAGWAAILFIGISSAIGYFLWLYALRRAAPTRVTIFLALSPATAAVIGVILLDEEFGPGLAAGIAFVALGLWVMARAKEGELHGRGS
ncbi:DMT family transporter [Hwanghaeella sp.]|uniref:DMT family transporter n=1 Tax=Hwanghaeella sp. TaxID=2605943 RepID=UPI003CCBF46F